MLSTSSPELRQTVKTLKRYRTGGEQKVTVQHVTVSDNAQATVGNVSTGAAARPSPKGQAKAVANMQHERNKKKTINALVHAAPANGRTPVLIGYANPSTPQPMWNRYTTPLGYGGRLVAPRLSTRTIWDWLGPNIDSAEGAAAGQSITQSLHSSARNG